MGSRELQINKLREKCDMSLADGTTWSGKETALEELPGSWDETSQKLYRWRAQVLEKVPGSVIEIDTQTVDGRVCFRRFFCTLKPCVDGFLEGCRPYLSIDATKLNGEWNGQLAAANGLDGNNWMYPVAFGFFDTETMENWSWFMSMLKVAIGEPPVLAICTDCCKGLQAAVQSVFPNAEQRECVAHLMQTILKRFPSVGSLGMYSSMRAYRCDVWHEKMKPVFRLPHFHDYMHMHHSLKWMRCAFHTAVKCDYITNGVAEAFTDWVKDIKDLPIVDLADKLRELIMSMWIKRRKVAAAMQGRILPTVLDQLRAKLRGCLSNLEVVRGCEWSAEVTDTRTYNPSVRHVVKLREMTCSCLEWQHTGKPCEHALALIILQHNIEDFVHEYFSVSKFKAAYGSTI